MESTRKRPQRVAIYRAVQPDDWRLQWRHEYRSRVPPPGGGRFCPYDGPRRAKPRRVFHADGTDAISRKQRSYHRTGTHDGRANGNRIPRYRRAYARRAHTPQWSSSNGRVSMIELTIRRRKVRAVSTRGYTVVELMMALGVFAIGVSGIIAMQKVAAAANQHSRALSLATNIAQAWQDQLSADSSLFNQANGLLGTRWLAQLNGAGNQVGWFRPTYNQNLGIGAAFDELGNPVDETAANPKEAQFCVHLRLTRLYPTSPGIEVIRTEVRVIWPRAQGTMSQSFCDTSTDAAKFADDPNAYNNYHFLYQASAVRQQ